jgi:hypothetical protein
MKTSSCEGQTRHQSDAPSPTVLLITPQQAPEAPVSLRIRPLVTASEDKDAPPRTKISGDIKGRKKSRPTAESVTARRALPLPKGGQTLSWKAAGHHYILQSRPIASAPGSNSSHRRALAGERAVIDAGQRLVARAAALRVLSQLKHRAKLLRVKEQVDKPLAIIKPRALKTRKVDVAKVWESAVRFFEAQHALKKAAATSSERA